MKKALSLLLKAFLRIPADFQGFLRNSMTLRRGRDYLRPPARCSVIPKGGVNSEPISVRFAHFHCFFCAFTGANSELRQSCVPRSSSFVTFAALGYPPKKQCPANWRDIGSKLRRGRDYLHAPRYGDPGERGVNFRTISSKIY